MNSRITHRGPDETTIAVVDKHIVMGFNRLEIVGGEKAKQPIYNKEKTLVLICNGEIYNHKNLQKKYCKKHTFSTTSDAEIILHLYEEMGDAFVSKLEGQFAFILFDKKQKRIIFGRDRFGILPLFFTHIPDGIIISSEIKGLMASGLVKDLSFDVQEVINTWFFYGPNPPKTCFKTIIQLPRSTLAVYSYAQKKYSESPYWSLSTTKVTLSRKKSILKNIESYLEASVKQCLQGSYRVGAYISGGVDSSIIATLIKRFSRNRPILFGVAFADEVFDERKYQIDLAKYLNCELRQVIINPKDLEDNLVDYIYHTETPITRTAPIPFMLLSKLAHTSKVKFVLCSEGADELFLGYPVFKDNLSSIEAKRKKKTAFLKYFNPEIKVDRNNKKIYKDLTKNSLGQDSPNRLRLVEINTKLSRYLLATQGDRMSMANSIEQRFPYLNSNVVSVACTLKKDDLIDELLSKLALRDAFENKLPNEFLYRPKKGYLAPNKLLAQSLISSVKWSRLFSKRQIYKIGIFVYDQLKTLIQKGKKLDNLSEEEAQFIIFVSSVHLLYELYIDRAKKKNK